MARALPVAAGLLWWCAAVQALAQSYAVVHTLTAAEGTDLAGNLVQSGTTLYGTASSGGASNFGTVFKLNIDGTECTVLKSFAGPPGDGASPYQGLVLSDGSLYGTTYKGGISNRGTVFKLNTDGSGYTVLHQFTGPPDDGAFPYCTLVISGGRVYGTTESGGYSNVGTVFGVDADGGSYAVLKHFTGPAPGDSGPGDGAMLHGRLALSGTTLYGSTVYGGLSGNGVIFKLEVDGTGFAVLREGNYLEGDHFQTGLLLSGDTLFGSTPWGGGGIGCVYSLNRDGTGYRVLKSFTGFDGVGVSSLILSNSWLYGTSGSGGISNCGVVFALSTNGADFTLLRQFTGGGEARGPGGLMLSGTTLYGTAATGAPPYTGVVYRLELPLPALLASPQSQTAESGTSVAFTAQASGSSPLTFEWFFNGTNLLTAGTNASLLLTAVLPEQTGSYTVAVTNVFGAVTSAPAMLAVIPPVPRRMVPGLLLSGQAEQSLDLLNSLALGPTANWLTLDTVVLTNSSQWYFDVSEPAPPQKYYRALLNAGPPASPSLLLQLVPALTLAGTVGGVIRVDCINQFGPIDAWVTLDTVTLAAPSQLYFDTSWPGQPPRLYRLIPVP